MTHPHPHSTRQPIPPAPAPPAPAPPAVVVIPDSIRRRVATLPATSSALALPIAGDREATAGDVRRAGGAGGEERLVLVLKVQPGRSNAQVTLVHPNPEYATTEDVLVDPAVSGVAYPIVVEAGLRGIVWLRDLGPLVAELPAEVVTLCLRPGATAPTGPGLSVGTRYCGPLDARAAFKQREYASLARLCAGCTAVALDGPADGSLDTIRRLVEC